MHADGLIKLLDDANEAFNFFFDLVFATEDVRIVLSQSTYARKAAKFAGFFVAIIGGSLHIAHRHFAISTGTGGENLSVMRTVHGFHGKIIAVDLRVDHEQLVAEFGIMAGCFIEVGFSDVGSKDLFETFAATETERVISH